jgi:hypothetical protein
VAAACLVIATWISGRPGLFGAALASITVIIFFIVHILVARLAEMLDPMTTMALAMFSYFAKVLLMGAFLLLVTRYTDRESVDRASFAICAILITMTWLIGEIRSFLKLRLHLPLPKKEGQD